MTDTTTIEVESLPLSVEDVIVQGATFRRTYMYLPGGEAAVDFATWTARMQLRGKVADSDGVTEPLLELTTENGGLELDAEGYVYIVMTAAETQSLTKGAKFDLEFYQPAGDTIRFLKGFLALDKEVTR